LIDRRSILAGLAALAATQAAAAPAAYRPPRTRSGAPSLEGVWTGGTYTQLERPAEFKGLVATPAEIKAFEARLATTGGVNVPPGVDPIGQVTSEFPETGPGLSRIRGEARTSHIVDPADGQIPWTAQARKDLHIGEHGWQHYDNPEERPHNERCLAASITGPPLLPAEDANILQILQTPDHVVVLTERYHDARVIRLAAGPPPPGPGSWLGDSTGRWDGETLVVQTRNLKGGVLGHGDDLYLSGRTQVEERFTRIAEGEILYAFTVSDPYLFTQPWRGEIVLRTSPGRYFSYDCHEGNYALTNILTAARLGRQPEPKSGAAP
jgi:hypothetical protein